MSQVTKTLKKKSILVEKPWALVDNDGAIQKLIFRKDKRLVLSKNGVVTEGTWDYYSEARSLFIDRGTDRMLLNEQYIDENVIILKRDGTDNEFFALANENTIPNYDIPGYLFKKRCSLSTSKKYELTGGKVLLEDGVLLEVGMEDKQSQTTHAGFLKRNVIPKKVQDGNYLTKDFMLAIQVKDGRVRSKYPSLVIDLIDGNILQTFRVKSDPYFRDLLGEQANLLNADNTLTRAPDGAYMTKNKEVTIIVKNGLISSINENAIFSSPEGFSYEIEKGDQTAGPRLSLHRKVTINGRLVDKDYLKAREDIIYKLENSIVVQVLFIRTYNLICTHNLSKNYIVRIEHKNSPKIKRGNKIINFDSIEPIPDGKYWVKGSLRWIRIKDCTIV